MLDMNWLISFSSQVDFSKFKTNMTNSNEVFSTFDGAAGLIKAEVVRKHKSSL